MQARLADYQQKLAVLTLFGAVWNTCWYGMQHLGDFWGNAAFISGILIMYTSLPLLSSHGAFSLVKALHKKQPPQLNSIALVLLLLCAIIYTYTLILLQFD